MPTPPITTAENGQKTADYSTASSAQKANEAATKAALTAPLEANANDAVPASVTPAGNESKTMGFKVRISSAPGLNDSTVIFEVMPTITESQSANYTPFSPIQHPGEILKYNGTQARPWGLTVKIISRTPGEASDNLRKLNLVRSWLMPFYGQGTADNNSTKQYLGAPPPILTLSAYGAGAIGPVKCVMESYNWEWPNDCDYVNTMEGTPFPVIGTLTITLKETWSPAEYSSFDLMSYRTGNLSKAFGGSLGKTQNSSSGASKTNPTKQLPTSYPASQPIVVKNPLDIAKEAVAPFTAGATGLSVSKSPIPPIATNVSKTLTQQVNSSVGKLDFSGSAVSNLPSSPWNKI